MATLTGNNGVVKIDNAGGTPTAVLNVRNFTVDLTSDTIETTTMGIDVRTYTKGLAAWSGSADVYFDTTTPQLTSIASLNPTALLVGAATVTCELYLNDSANKFSGEAIITGFSISSSMDGLVEASISFQGSGACTYTA